MIANDHQKLADFIWSIANKLRGPYRPPQYRKVMLPLIVLRRLDCVLEATKDEVLKKYAALKNKGLSQTAIEKALAKTASKDRNQPLYNISRYTFQKLLGDPDGLAKNLTAYIKGFSPKVREIFEKFEFEAEIEKLDGANRLFEIIKEFSAIDLHPENVSNIADGLCIRKPDPPVQRTGERRGRRPFYPARSDPPDGASHLHRRERHL